MTMQWYVRLGCAALTLMLAGCAAQRAYTDGQELARQGRYPEAMVKLEEAVRIEPGSAQYRIASVQTRDRWIQTELQRSGDLHRQGRLEEAERAYQGLLGQPGATDRALAALKTIDRQRRASAWLSEAQALFEKKDLDGARGKLRSVLIEDPGNEAARTLLNKLEDAGLPGKAPSASLAAAYRKPIAIEFKDAALKSVFDVLSRSSGLNFLFDKDVRSDQKTSIYLRNSTIEAALNLVLLTNQLEQRVLDGNSVLIYPNTPAKQKEYQPLTIRSFYLVNAEAKTVASTLKTLLKARDVVVDDKLNLLMLRDTPEAIRVAEKIVALHDVPESEVMLEVEILEVKRTRLLDLGVRWPDQLNLAPLAATNGGTLSVADLRSLNSSRIAASIGSVSINAKNINTDANILANPRIRVRNREKAKILIGQRVPNITATSTSTGFVAETINYVDVGLKLEVDPTIYLDGEVAIKISLEVSSIINQLQTKSGSTAYEIGTRTAQTVLRLKDGENQVLAGLINDEERRAANKVPVLGDAPVVGRLFGSQADDGSKTEIVLSITPRILRNVKHANAALLEFDSGTESSFSTRATSAATTIAAPAQRSATSPAEGPQRSPAQEPAATSGTSPIVVAPPVSASEATAPGVGRPQQAGGGNGAALRWEAPPEAKPGESFTLQVLVQSGQPLVSVPLAIGFDPRAIEISSVTEGEFLRQGGATTSFASRVDPGGQVLITGTRAGDTGATALSTFATINVRVLAPAAGETVLRVLAVGPIGLGGRSVPVSPPAPHTIRIRAN